MRKGCFIKSVVILTIIIAVVIYLLQNYSDEYIFKPGKKFITNEIKKEFDKKLDYVKDTPEKDALEMMMISYIENNINSIKDLENKKIERILKAGEGIVNDSVITPEELEKIKKMIEEE